MISSHLLLLLSAVAPGILAWGAIGHQLTGAIAMQLASQSSLDTISKLIPDMQGDLKTASTWADSVKYTKQYAYTRNYHFLDAKDNPPTECSVDQERDCPGGKCLTGALANYTTQLSCGKSQAVRSDALKFVMHFLGDLTQPLHNCARQVGGNSAKAVFSQASKAHKKKGSGPSAAPAQPTLTRRAFTDDRDHMHDDKSSLNLHAVWDTTMIEYHMKQNDNNDFDTLLQELMQAVQAAQQSGQAADWTACVDGQTSALDCAVTWSKDSDGLNCGMVWSAYDSDPSQDLSGSYYEQAWPIVVQQIAKAGIRAAAWFDANLKAC